MSVWNFKKADWDRYRTQAEIEITDSLISSSTDDSCRKISDTIIKVASMSIPKNNGSKNRKKSVPYWNEECTQAVKHKGKARKHMQRTKTLESQQMYREVKAKAQLTLKTSERECWQEYCSTINNSTKLESAWKMAKKMSGVRSGEKMTSIKEGDKILTSNEDKAYAIARNIARNSSNNNYPVEFKINKNEHQMEQEKRNTENINNDSPIHEIIEFHELHRAIRQCKNNSAPGEDEIAYEMLKYLPKNALKTILKLFNNIWLSGKLPTSWKHSIVLPFIKPGKEPTNPDSYRPILSPTGRTPRPRLDSRRERPPQTRPHPPGDKLY